MTASGLEPIHPLELTQRGHLGRSRFHPSRLLTGKLRLVLVGALLGTIGAMLHTHRSRGDRRVELAAVLAERGLQTTPEEIVFLREEHRWDFVASSRAVVLGSESGELRDAYLVFVRLSPAGAIVDVGASYNLTSTTGAEERALVVDEAGRHAAFVSKSAIEGAASTVTLVDLAGHGPPSMEAVAPSTDEQGGEASNAPFTAMERAQQAITDYQETGQLKGVGKTTLLPTNAAADAGEPKEVAIENLRFDGPKLAFDLNDGSRKREVRYALAERAVEVGVGDVSLAIAEVARPGNLVTWSVDRVRAVIGDDAMQAIKQTAFAMKDFVDEQREGISTDNGAADIAEDLGTSSLGTPEKVLVTDPDIGWPPAPLEAWITPGLPGEGQWNAKEEDGFFRQMPNLPPTFLTTFIRSDRNRKTTRVYIAMWDPRLVELHMMAGTVEPKSATGNAGPGLIPRTPDVMKRVVGALNAGFQALHGEYGMMADGVVYLPPKPYAATVGALRDGSTAFGTWPNDAAVPDQVLSYRQNMTVMVENEKFNPYDRTWWGGTVPGAEDKTHTVRTGICLTREKFIAYFYGADLSPDGLAQAMIQTRCSYGIALDMNAGHSGLEFYRVDQTPSLPALGRGLETSWEAEGSVPGMEGWSFRARRLIKGMGLMNFPRYIKREARDFFYLTVRHAIPGANLTSVEGAGKPGDGEWKVKGLPQHGFPYAVASTEVALAPGERARVLQIDPRALAVGGQADKTVALVDPGETKTGKGLYFSPGAFSVADTAPPNAALLAHGVTELTGRAMIGLHAESGMLFYAEIDGATGPVDLKRVDALLAGLGCTDRLALTEPLTLALGGDTSLAGAAVRVNGKNAVRLTRAQTPDGRRFFEDTPIVGRDVWYPLQQQRVRYFKKRD